MPTEANGSGTARRYPKGRNISPCACRRFLRILFTGVSRLSEEERKTFDRTGFLS